jgi:hypothetical protein
MRRESLAVFTSVSIRKRAPAKEARRRISTAPLAAPGPQERVIR